MLASLCSRAGSVAFRGRRHRLTSRVALPMGSDSLDELLRGQGLCERCPGTRRSGRVPLDVALTGGQS